MYIERISLRDVRIYASLDFHFPSTTTIFLGSNGVGKTTILETIHVFSTLQSFRTGRLKDLVRHGTKVASARMTCSDDIQQSWSFEIPDTGAKTLKKNNKRVRSAKFIEDLRVVALVPEHQKLLDTGAEERRKFLDRVVFSQDTSFLEVSRRYQKALQHKRALLRQELPWKVYEDQASVWNQELVDCAAEMRSMRKDIAETLRPLFLQEHDYLGEGEVTLDYEQSEESLAEALAAKGSREHAAGRVLYGPHRDDLVLCLRRRRTYEGASQGERSSLLLALKFAEIALLQGTEGRRLVLLLDDLGATLDPKRRSKLFERIESESVQTLITTTDERVAHAAKAHQKDASEVCLDEHPAGFSFARRQAT